MMKHCMSRRKFLAHGSAAVLSGGLAAGSPGSVTAKEPVREYRRGGMLYRRLGETDLFVSALSFGSHTDPAFKKPVDGNIILTEEGQKRRDNQIAHALDLGVNMVDTYENEGQLEPMARLVRNRRDKVLVSTCRQFPVFVGQNIDQVAKLYGHVDLYRIYVNGPGIDGRLLEDWDVMRKAKAAGKVRAIGISTHDERVMNGALAELEGLDYIMFPYNFIHARADYAEFLPAAIRKNVGLIAIKPLAAGSIAKLDPRSRKGTKPQNERIDLFQSRDRPLLPAVVSELTKSLDRLPDETLCQAAMRFVYSKPFITAALPGIFQDADLVDNHKALSDQLKLTRAETDVLEWAARVAAMQERRWLPNHYRWLDERWRA
jgi:aryl-alcohol dehydrogenase-like predicted oxidoreductase